MQSFINLFTRVIGEMYIYIFYITKVLHKIFSFTMHILSVIFSLTNIIKYRQTNISGDEDIHVYAKP